MINKVLQVHNKINKKYKMPKISIITSKLKIIVILIWLIKVKRDKVNKN